MSPVKPNTSLSAAGLKRLGRALQRAREDAGMEQMEVANELQVHYMTVSRWETGKNAPDDRTLARLAKLYGTTVSALLNDVSHETSLRVPRTTGAWPDGWRVRAYRLQLEAVEAGATEEEIATVNAWMLDPQIQTAWSGGASKGEVKDLAGIETGARAWLRARGRKVKPG